MKCNCAKIGVIVVKFILCMVAEDCHLVYRYFLHFNGNKKFKKVKTQSNIKQTLKIRSKSKSMQIKIENVFKIKENEKQYKVKI